MERDVTRRSFLASAGKAALGAGALAAALPAPALGRTPGSPADRINVGLIGCGGQGRGVMGGFMGRQEVEVLAVCDVDDGHSAEAARQVEKKYGRCHLTNLAYQAGRGLRWDPAKEVVIDDAKAMELGSYQREYRAPWKLPRYEPSRA